VKIRVVNYTASISSLVQAFVDIEVDGWLRFNGLNLHRDGKLWSAQLTRIVQGKRVYRNAVQILDGDLSELLRADILDAIRAHIETLPPEERVRPPKPPGQMIEPRKPETVKKAVTNDHCFANGRKPVPPPARLLVAARERQQQKSPASAGQKGKSNVTTN
jgi:hypothetical protein